MFVTIDSMVLVIGFYGEMSMRGGAEVRMAQGILHYFVMEVKGSAMLKYSRRFHIINPTTTLDVWTRRVWVWIELRNMVVEAMVVLWEG